MVIGGARPTGGVIGGPMSETGTFKETTVTVRDCTVTMLRGGKGDPLLYLHGGVYFSLFVFHYSLMNNP